ncbi:MAG: response regulator [Gemmatimonadales bacterium]|nr:response regulator [Gemmatimonadales bacterium]
MPPAEILVIEHEPLARELLVELLTLRGRGQLKISQSPDLRGGLALLRQRTFDLVLLDTRLPDATPLHALRVIGEQAPMTPILPHLSFITPKARQTARERGVFDVVVRGELNPLWSAANKLLTLRALGHDDRAAVEASRE